MVSWSVIALPLLFLFTAVVETIPGESIYMEEDEASVSLYEEDEDQRERGDAVLASGSFYND